MPLFLLEISGAGLSTVDDTKAMIVEANDAATAKLLASAQEEGDSDWSGATATAIAAGVASDYAGFRYRLTVGGPSPGTPDALVVEATGAPGDDIDDIGAALWSSLGNRPLDAAIADDGGAFTDYTAAAAEDTDDDVALLPASPTVGDAFLFGAAEPFSRLAIDVTTQGSFSHNIIWKYWNGGGWSNLSNVVDQTLDFQWGGLSWVTFSRPADWEKTTINSQGPYYFVRAELTTGTGATPVPKAGRAFVVGRTFARYDSTTKTFTISGEESLGDRTLVVEAFPPGAARPLAELVGTITHQGNPSNDLSVVFSVPTAIPAVMRKL